MPESNSLSMVNANARPETPLRCSIILPAASDSSKLNAYLLFLSQAQLPGDYEVVVVNDHGLKIDERRLKELLPILKVLNIQRTLTQERLFDTGAMAARGKFLLFVKGLINFDKLLLEESIKELETSGEKVSLSARKNFILAERFHYTSVGKLERLFGAVSSLREDAEFMTSRKMNRSRNLCDDSNEYCFDGTCMVPMQSWNAKMELEHWNRYMTFFYLAESKNILDVACGEGYGTHLLSLLANKAIGIDLSIKNINHANSKYVSGKDNLKYMVADACNLPLKRHTIDVVYSFETIEHLRDIPAFLSNLSSVMSDQGIGIISTPRPNINPVSNQPFNPHHVHELSIIEFKSYLSKHFGHIELLGQSMQLPYEIHREFDGDKDTYVIAIVSNDENALKRIIRQFPDRKIISIREELFERHFNTMKNFSEPLRILFVPLTNTNCDNPSDRRRILLPANYLRKYGAEIAVVNKEDTLKIKSDIIYSQNRDYEFWLNNINRLTKNGRHLVFTFSDALGITSPSKTHDFEAFSGKGKSLDAAIVHKNLKLFLEKCCSHIFAASDLQRKFISNLTPNVPITILSDPVDTETYNADLTNDDHVQRNKEFTLIWEGFCDNVPYLLVCAEPIKRLSKTIPLRVIIATSKTRRNKFLGTTDNKELAKRILGDIVQFHVWDKESISKLMAKSDVGLAPLFMDCQFARAKPANKAIIYNYMKLPVIASPTIEYKLYVQNNLNGFIANTQTDWEKYIEYLYNNPKEREKIREYGHKKAKENHIVDGASKQMLRVFSALVQRSSPEKISCKLPNLY